MTDSPETGQIPRIVSAPPKSGVLNWARNALRPKTTIQQPVAEKPTPMPLHQLELHSWMLPTNVMHDVEQGLTFPHVPEFVGALELKAHGITGKGIKIAVIDPIPEYQNRPSSVFIGMHEERVRVHGFGIAGIIKTALPEAQVFVCEASTPEMLLAQIRSATQQGVNVINLSMEKQLEVRSIMRLLLKPYKKRRHKVLLLLQHRHTHITNEKEALRKFPELLWLEV